MDNSGTEPRWGIGCWDDTVLDPPEAVGFSCVSPYDSRRLNSACARGYGPKDVNYCVLIHTGEAGCADGSSTALERMSGWVCLSPLERDRFLAWCSRNL